MAESLRMRQDFRRGDDGTVRLNALVEAKAEADRNDAQIAALADDGPLQRDAGIGNWEWLGPGNIGGRVRAIAFFPNSASDIWIGGVSGGLWRTPNTGQTWTPVNDFMASLAVTSIVFDSTDTRRFYVGTGEPTYSSRNFETNGLPGGGVFMTANDGQTWTQLASTNPAADARWRYVMRLAHHPTTAGTLYAAGFGALMRTTDFGATWTAVLTPPAGELILDVDVNPANGNQVLVGTMRTVYLSTTGGNAGSFVDQSGTAAGRIQTNTPGCTGAGCVGNECQVAFGSGSNMWVSCRRNAGEVWRSTDGGANWVLRNTGTNYIAQGLTNAIWASPDDLNLVVVGGLDPWRSTDAGQTFTRIGDWTQYHTGLSAHADQHFIVQPPGYSASDRRLFFANDGGVQFVQNIYNAQTTTGWTSLANGLGITQFYGGAVQPGGYRVYGGTQDNSILRYQVQDGTENWFQATTGDGGYVAVDPMEPGIIYSEFQNLQVIKSTGAGASWSNAMNGLGDANTTPAQALFIAPLVMDPNNPDVLIAGGQSIWRTTDEAANWTSIRGPTTQPNCGGPPAVPGVFCSAIDVAPGNTNQIWVGYVDQCNFGSAFNGRVSRTDGLSVTNWVDVDNNGPTPLPNRSVTDIAINPFNSQEVFVTMGGYATDTVWFTPDNGATWANRNGTAPWVLPAIQVNTVRFHPVKRDWVYVGTDIGVYSSTDKGLHWNRSPAAYPSAAHDGPANVEIAELFWDFDWLYAATHGRGMYRTRPTVRDCLAWTQRFPASSPSPRYSHAMVYDSARQVVVLFGGGTGLPQLGDTWEFDGDNWTLRSTTGPSPRTGHAMAYDPVRQKTLLFGGRDVGSFHDDTWEWDGNVWVQRSPSVHPSARYLHAMAYDSANNRIVLYGGSNEGTGYPETWEWYPVAGNWGLSNNGAGPENPKPGHVQGHAMAYNSASDRVMMVGGTSAQFLIQTPTTWEWDGVAKRWNLVGLAPVSPFRPTMAFDTTRNRMRFYGGEDSDGRFLDGTYDWDGTNWQFAGNGAPSGRTDPVMVYDASRDMTVLFGGRTEPSNQFNDTWVMQTARPYITTQPQCKVVREGQPITLSVGAGGSAPLTYQWRKVGVGDLTDDGRIAGSTTATLTISPSQLADTGDYWVTISDRCNGTTSSVTVRVVVLPPLAGGTQVTAFGQNSWGQLGRGTSCSSSNCDTRIREVSNIANVVQVSGNVLGFHSIALCADGTVRTWGSNSYGQIGNGTIGGPNVLTPHTVAGLTDVMAVAAGGEFSLALKADGTVWGWGQNWSYALGDAVPGQGATAVPVQIPNVSCVVAIGATTFSSYAVKSNGGLWSWGRNNFGELGIGSISFLERNPQAVLNLGSEVVAVSGGMGHVLALKSDGTVWGWGYNNAGQTGDGTTTNRHTPAQVAGLANIVKFRAGQSHSLALRNDGVALGWGYNATGELGRGHTTSPMFTPAPVLTSFGLTTVADVAAGSNHSVFLRSDGTVWTVGTGVAETGYPTQTHLGTPRQVSRVVFPCVGVDTGRQTTYVRHAPTPPYFDTVLGGQPRPQGAIVGGLITLTTVPYGTPSLQYAWHHNGNGLMDDGRITGASSPNLTVFPAALPDAGSYFLRVTNLQGPSDSNVVTVTVEPTPFCDEFTGAANPLWGQEVGTWSVSNGHYYSSLNTYSSLPFELADFSVDVDIVNTQTGGIWLRSRRCTLSPAGNNCEPQDPGIAWIHGVQLWHTAGSLAWYAYVAGSWTGPHATKNNAYTVGANVHLRVEVIGDTYRVFVDGSVVPATQYTNASYPSGRFALNDYSGPAQRYDRVCINGTPVPTPDGDMNDDGRVNGMDIQAFVGGVVAGAMDPPLLAHGDFNGNGMMDAGDAPGFIQALVFP